MVRRNRLLMVILALMISILAACSNGENEKQVETENQNDASTQKESGSKTEDEEDSTDSTEEVSFEVNQGLEDQGDLEVKFEGDIHVENKVVSVKGTTNLLPESQLTLLVDSEDGVLIGTSDRARVNENGSFELETTLPDNVEGILHIEVKFEPTSQDVEEIKNHYLNELSGGFVRNYVELDETYQKASFQQTITLDEGEEQTFAITEPSWEIPDDYGEATVWIEPEIEKQGDYVAVKINSNIIDGTFIQARASIPDYITWGIQGSGYINPDGSAVLYFEDPEKDSRIKNLTEYDIIITMEPSNSNNGPHVTEIYGENGQNLAGDFVDTEDGSKVIRQTITVTVEE